MRTLLPSFFLLITAIIVFTAAPSGAAILTVRQDGTGQYADIQTAIAAASAGDIVLVGDGTWTGAANRNLDPGGKAITIASENGPAACILDCQNAAASGFHVHTSEDSTTTIRGFTIRNAAAGGVVITGASPAFRNNVITGCTAAWGAGGGGLRAEDSRSLVSDNVFENNETREGEHGGGLFLHNFDGRLVNNVIRNNVTGAGGRGGGVYMESGCDTELINNLFFANEATGAGGEGGGLYASSSIPDLINCTLIRNECYEASGGGGMHASGSNVHLVRCIVWNNFPTFQLAGTAYGVTWSCVTGGWSGTGNISSDPKLVNLSGGDAHLQATSPCVDAGGTDAASVCLPVVDGAVTVCLDQYTTRTDESDDAGTVDMGYHYGHGQPRWVPDDFATLQAAVDHAVPGDVIRVRAGTHAGFTFAGKPVRIESESGPEATFLGMSPPNSIVRAIDGESTDAVLSGFTLRNADFVNKGGGIYCEGASPRLHDLTIHGCVANWGGGMACYAGAQPWVAGVVLYGNVAMNKGGALQCETGSDPLLENVTIYGNTATDGGTAISSYNSSQVQLVRTIINGCDGVSTTYCGGGGTISCRCCDVYGNPAGDWTGGLAGQLGVNGNFSANPRFCDAANHDFGLADNSPCAAANNPGCGLVGALPAGGCGDYVARVCPDGSGDYPTIQAAIDASFDGDVIELCDGVFTGDGNRNVSFGGRDITVRSVSGDPTLTILDCEGVAGLDRRGFVFNSGETRDAILEGVTIRNARAWHAAGLFCEAGASPTIRDCIFEDNLADSRGGGMSAHNGSAPLVERCVFRDNVATTDGGGMRCYDGMPLVVDCIFDGNTAGAEGGAIYLNGGSSPHFQDCLLTHNQSVTGAGALHSDGASDATLEECLIYGGSGGTAAGLTAESSGSAVGVRCIITATVGGPAASCATGGVVLLSCSDVWGNFGGDWMGCLAGQQGSDGNISLDPMFCDAAGDDYSLAADSPCAPGVSPCGGMGPFGVGCSAYILYVMPDGSGDYPTIQAAIDAVPPGGTVKLGDGTFTGAGNRDLDDRGKTFTLCSWSGNSGHCIIDCQGSESEPHRGLVLDGGQDSAMLVHNLTFANAWHNYGGAIHIDGPGSPKVRGCRFIDCSSSDGGGIFVSGGATPIIEYCAFDGCSASNAGGGLRFSGSGGSVDECYFHDGYGHWGGGGIYLYQSAPTVTGCFFRDNTCHAWGADMAIHDSSSNTTIAYCTFVRGTSPDGAVRMRGGASPLFTNCVFAFASQGAAVSCDATSSVTLECCDVYDNPGGDWVGCIAGQGDSAGNFSAHPLYCDMDNDWFGLATASPCLAENNPGCGQVGDHGWACSVPSAVPGESREVPRVTALTGCTPNPFNPTLVVSYDLARAGRVEMAVYGVDGRRVRTLEADLQRPGSHQAVWNGRDDRGRAMPSGVYFVRLAADGGISTRKVMLLR